MDKHHTSCSGISATVFALIAGCWLLTGCINLSPKTDPTAFYLLESVEMTPESAEDSMGIYVSRVELPDYIDSNRLFLRSAGGSPQYLEADLWAEPLADGFGRALALNLGQVSGRSVVSAYPHSQPSGVSERIRVRVLRFEAVASQGVHLDAVYEISGGERGARLAQRITIHEGDGSYPDAQTIVLDMNRALASLARGIAQTLEAEH